MKLSLLLVLMIPFGPGLASAADAAKTFALPEEAVSALAAAVKTKDRESLRAIFGSAAEDIANPDRVQATNDFNVFADAFALSHRLVRETETKRVIEVGTNNWPFPIPLVEQNGRWSFDTAAGRTEILNRRIGKNELEALEVVRAYVEAQREYASQDRDGDDVLEYAQRLASSPDKKDGLYWPPEADGEISPLGPLVAEARGEGYDMATRSNRIAAKPLHGYFFKILTRQGRHAPGGRYDYVINGNMIGGFALVAWPAEYGESGIMTLIVNQQGRVYERDLGKNTGGVARKMTTYDPDPAWKVSNE